jgi:tape measure domain-containing protein
MAILLKTISDSSQAQKDLKKLEASVENINKSTEKLGNSFAFITKSIGLGLAAFAGFSAFTKYSDSLTVLENRLRVATSSQKEFYQALIATRKIASETRQDLKATADLYSKISLVSKSYGLSQSQVAKATELTSKAIIASGSSSEAARFAAIQFAQAIGSNRLSGDELRSVLENAPVLALEIAEGLGVGIGQLRKMGEAGDLFATRVLGGILKQQDSINARFAQMGVTYGQAFTNLGNSLLMVFSSVQKAFFGSRSSFAQSINELAIRLSDVASKMEITFFNAKLTVLDFIFDTIDAFDELWDNIKGGLKSFNKGISEFVDTGSNKLLIVLQGVSGALLGMFAVAAVQAKKFFEYISNFSILRQALVNFKTFVLGIIDVVRSLLIKIPKIDPEKYFVNLKKSLDTVKAWSGSVYDEFYTLYSKTLLNSPVPDLINGVTQWFNKLTDKPLKSVQEMTSKSNKFFMKLRFIAPAVGVIGIFARWKKELLIIAGIAATIAAVIGGISLARSKGYSLSSFSKMLKDEKTSKAILDKLKLIATNTKDTVRNTVDQYKEKITNEATNRFDQTSPFVRNFKQIMGVPDRYPGKIYGEQIDTTTITGRGPSRDIKNPFPGSNIIAALPSEKRVPVVTGFAATLVGAILIALKASPIRSVLISAVTTAWGFALANATYPSERRKFFGGAALGILDRLEQGIAKLFSGNVLKDPFGLLTLIAKTSLLFEAGRKFFLGKAISAFTAPTKISQGLASTLRGGIVNQRLRFANAKVDSARDADKAAISKATQELNKNIVRLQRLSINGRTLGATGAQAALKTQTFGQVNVPQQSRIVLLNALNAEKALAVANKNAEQFDRINKDILSRQDELQTESKKISDSMKEAGENLVNGIKNFAAGAGGIIGGVAGFQIGAEIVRGMGDEVSEWKKMSIMLASSFAGQAIGSGMGLVFASVAIGVFKLFFITWVGGIFRFLAIKIGAQMIAAISAGVFGKAASAFLARMTIGMSAAVVGGWTVGLPLLLIALIAGAIYYRKEIIEAWDNHISPMLEKVWDKLIQKIKEIDWKDLFRRNAEVRDKTFERGGNFASEVAKGVAKGIGSEIKHEVDLIIKAFTFDVPSTRQPAYMRMPEGSPGRAAALRREEEEKARRQRLARGYASGGFIVGPGSAKSDSIPAMLSNGEFVINAAATRKNREILEAINQGKVAKMFNGGGSTSARAPYRAEAIPTLPGIKSDELLNYASKTAESTEDFLAELQKGWDLNDPTMILKAIWGLLKTSFNSLFKKSDNKDSTDNSIANRYGNSQLLAGDKLIVSELKKIGVGGITAEDLKDVDAATKREIVETLDRVAELGRDRNGNPVKAGTARAAAFEDAKRDAYGIIASRLVGASGGKIQPITQEAPKISFEKALEDLNSLFPKYNLTMDEFIKLPNEVRNSLINQTIGKTDIKKGILESNATSGDKSRQFANFEESLVPIEKSLVRALSSVRKPFGIFAVELEKFNLSIEEAAYNTLEDADLSQFNKLFENYSEIVTQLNSPADQLGPGVRASLQKRAVKLATEITEKVDDANAKVMLTVAEQLKRSFGKFDISLDESIYDLASDKNQQKLAEIVERLKKSRDELENETNAERRRNLRRSIAEDSKEAQKIIERSNLEYKNFATQSAEAFANSITDNFRSGLKDVLGGKKSFKEFLRGIADNFANSVIDTFVDGLTAPLVGEKGILTTLSKKLGESIFTIFSDSEGEGFGGFLSKLFKKDKKTTNSEESSLSKSGISDLSKVPSIPKLFESPSLISSLPGITPPGIPGLSSSGLVAPGMPCPCSPMGGMQNSMGSSLAGMASSLIPSGIPPLAAVPEIPSLMPQTEAGSEVALDPNSIGGIAEPITAGIGNVFAGITKAAAEGKGFWNSLLTLIPTIISAITVSGIFATGGPVKGKGTGTSDSIHAMLSNGEYVINAASTKRYYPLIEAINDGKIKKFAEGGPVTPIAMPLPMITRLDKEVPKNSSGQSIVNVNITGDISRQTKSEIMRMLPQITAGVNNQNKERGYKG